MKMKKRSPSPEEKAKGGEEGLGGLPEHLRPASIDTDGDSTTQQLVNMLGLIKSTPSPMSSDNDARGARRGRRHNSYRGHFLTYRGSGERAP